MFNPSDWYITPEEYERAAKNGISRSLLGKRIRGAGWDKERALATPPKKRRPRTDRSKWVEVAEKMAYQKPRFTGVSLQEAGTKNEQRQPRSLIETSV
ncbi:hypothetical protein S101413_02950 [Bacillus velezensis]|nr:hypothetical protein S101413_02950 [Bacillus velezensis]